MHCIGDDERGAAHLSATSSLYEACYVLLVLPGGGGGRVKIHSLSDAFQYANRALTSTDNR